MTTTIVDQRDALATTVRDLAESAKSAGRDLSPDEQQQISTDLTKIKSYDDQIRASKASADLLAQIAGIANGPEKRDGNSLSDAKSLGEHFINSAAYGEMVERKSVTRFTVGTAEFKAAPAPLPSTGLGQVQYGPVVPAALARPVVADLISSGTLNGTSLTYFVQGAVTGAFAPVAEGAEKPGLVFSFTPVTDPLAKIAGVTKITDETAEDAAAVVSIIDSQLRLRLALAEEAQIVSGSGTAPALRGILNRNGIQTETSAAKADNLDAIYRAITKVQTGSQLSADCVVINPTDYQAGRLAKDSAGQYLGGGPFTGAYGNSGLIIVPPIWGMPTVVTTAIPAGTVLVGAGKASTQLFRKGGVRVESTNSDEDDFRFNRIAIRAEERVLLAVYLPAAWVKVTLSST